MADVLHADETFVSSAAGHSQRTDQRCCRQPHGRSPSVIGERREVTRPARTVRSHLGYDARTNLT
jgi:hypothetical protein